ncbi:uncharacterized protein LOC141911792 [Tubulanus polymorphus]|uniref:uncharacterized protein LOC141911792 n=1 Tax=Tubulanus polymorphus TaxID=672921 RepID=UPI003DA58F81
MVASSVSLLLVVALVVMSYELIKALQSFNTKELERLLETGLNLNSRDNRGITPLYWASGYGNDKTVSYLIRRGADVNYVTSWNSFPLHAAADAGHMTIVKILLERGADVNCRDVNEDTPLHLASMKDLKPVVQYLLDSGADRTICNKKGRTALDEAIIHRSRECVLLLMNALPNRTIDGELVEKNGDRRKPLEMTIICNNCKNEIALRNVSMSSRDLIDRRSISGGFIARGRYIGSADELSEPKTSTIGGASEGNVVTTSSFPSTNPGRLVTGDQSNIQDSGDRSHFLTGHRSIFTGSAVGGDPSKRSHATDKKCVCDRETSSAITTTLKSRSLQTFTELKTNLDSKTDLISLVDALQLEVVKERERNELLEINSSHDQILLTSLKSDLSLERARSRYLSNKLAKYLSSGTSSNT